MSIVTIASDRSSDIEVITLQPADGEFPRLAAGFSLDVSTAY